MLLEERHNFSKCPTSYIADISRTTTSHGYFDVKRCGTSANTITEILIAFDKEAEFETKHP